MLESNVFGLEVNLFGEEESWLLMIWGDLEEFFVFL